MENSNRQSFFQDIQLREINGFRVRKRPYYDIDDSQGSSPTGAVAVEHDGHSSTPMALSFCKNNKNSHIIALTDEGGYVGLYNIRQKFSDPLDYQENAEKAKVSEWVAHDNAIFDICWTKEDRNLLTASGDQSIKVWDAKEKKCIRALMGHTGSVKSISAHPTNQDLVVSGARDGSFALWDTRCATSSYKKLCAAPVTAVHEAHLPCGRRRVRCGKAESMSITSVLYLKDEVSIATAGAVDRFLTNFTIPKDFWDTRHLKGPVVQACPYSESNAKEKKLHGISSLSQDLNGTFITASCMDHRIYLYDILQLEKGAVKTFSGGRIESFYVKSVISPDAAHILSGSSDGNAYIWQVSKPHTDPITLKSHNGEVSAVDWCPSEIGKVATCSDDSTVRLWNMQSSCYSNTRSPSLIRKRVMAMPRMECRRLFMDETSCIKSETENWSTSVLFHVYSPHSTRILEVSTPESQAKRTSFNSEVKENVKKNPEAEMKSPSSVLNPPSSLKRKTIRDYFQLS